ncbi:hypothetical protein evm_003471 [Chilo suppressalis]|nr:hypothetical protein evm_003471 [Chilo suppressalis]
MLGMEIGCDLYLKNFIESVKINTTSTQTRSPEQGAAFFLGNNKHSCVCCTRRKCGLVWNIVRTSEMAPPSTYAMLWIGYSGASTALLAMSRSKEVEETLSNSEAGKVRMVDVAVYNCCTSIFAFGLNHHLTSDLGDFWYAEGHKSHFVVLKTFSMKVLMGKIIHYD